MEITQQNTTYQKPITLFNILKFAVPTIAMTVFMSFYTMVDGLFVSNMIGTEGLSAINLTTPVIQLVTAISTMLATGGSAVVMQKIGAGKDQEAREDFTALIIINVIIGLIMGLIGYIFMDNFFASMGLSSQVFAYCKQYLGKYLWFTVPILLMNNFTLYMIASEKATISFFCSLAGGFSNIILDYIFLAVLDMGIESAAIATGVGYSITTIVGLILFSNKKNLLHFHKPVFRIQVLGKAATNGSSEMATALVTGIVTLVFNATMLKYVGESGVAAVTIIMYVLMFAGSLYSGYAYGVAPMISFYYGEQNKKKLQKLMQLSFTVIASIAILSMAGCLLLNRSLVSIFAQPNSEVFQLAVEGNQICVWALLFVGFNIFVSSMFTALSNGRVSAILAFSRSFVLMIACLLILPLIFGIQGVWLATPIAELLAFFLSRAMFVKYKKQYSYSV